MDTGELPVGYIAGIIDAKGSMKVTIYSDENYKWGYMPEARLEVTSKNEALIGLLDAFGEALGVNFHIAENTSKGNWTWGVTGADAVGTVLSEVYPYLILQSEKAEYYLSEILPFLADEQWRSEEGLVELGEMLEEVSAPGGRRKYTGDYFKKEFGLA